ncbi:unnamed protein product, partial [Polarella glacialis]
VGYREAWVFAGLRGAAPSSAAEARTFSRHEALRLDLRLARRDPAQVSCGFSLQLVRSRCLDIRGDATRHAATSAATTSGTGSWETWPLDSKGSFRSLETTATRASSSACSSALEKDDLIEDVEEQNDEDAAAISVLQAPAALQSSGKACSHDQLRSVPVPQRSYPEATPVARAVDLEDHSADQEDQDVTDTEDESWPDGLAPETEDLEDVRTQKVDLVTDSAGGSCYANSEVVEVLATQDVATPLRCREKVMLIKQSGLASSDSRLQQSRGSGNFIEPGAIGVRSAAPLRPAQPVAARDTSEDAAPQAVASATFRTPRPVGRASVATASWIAASSALSTPEKLEAPVAVGGESALEPKAKRLRWNISSRWITDPAELIGVL